MVVSSHTFKADSGEPDDCGLREKYYHSQGAACYQAGQFARAVRYFKRALALDERAYTRHDLALTYRAQGDIGRAYREITKAIQLSPLTAEYYYIRSSVRQGERKYIHAEKDRQKAIDLDPNYSRIEEIRAAARAVEQGLYGREPAEWCGTIRPKNEELLIVVEEIKRSTEKQCESIERRSCVVPCPAYCCHFAGEPVRHGVCIGAWKLRAIRESLKEKGLPEESHLGRLPFSGERHFVRLIPPDVVLKEAGQAFVFYPLRADKTLGKSLADDLPKATGYRDLSWISEDARACAFLDNGRCVIHDLGDESALPACKEFLCLTGFVFLTLAHIGVMREDDIRAKSLSELNRIAVEALLLLSHLIYQNRAVLGVRTALRRTLEDAVEADGDGRPVEVAAFIDQYRKLQRESLSLMSRQKELLRREVKKLLAE